VELFVALGAAALGVRLAPIASLEPWAAALGVAVPLVVAVAVARLRGLRTAGPASSASSPARASEAS